MYNSIVNFWQKSSMKFKCTEVRYVLHICRGQEISKWLLRTCVSNNNFYGIADDLSCLGISEARISRVCGLVTFSTDCEIISRANYTCLQNVRSAYTERATLLLSCWRYRVGSWTAKGILLKGTLPSPIWISCWGDSSKIKLAIRFPKILVWSGWA